MRKVLVKLDCHPYFPDIWFTNSRILFLQQLSKIRDEGIIHDLEDTIGMVSSDESRGKMVVGVFISDSGVLVHELSHAVINIFEAVNMVANTHTTEAFAYLLESLYNQCNHHLNLWSSFDEPR
ncbi:hypothetical protein Maynard_108 [Salmonella phage Maynard]|uniref:Uncharacterized protein n=9 Tax=Kuttervirus TaxID=2169536 RepID=A0A7T8EMS6_9CAUD|nr:hypothetical protein Maynard_108 [Salmonella phage Maynard]YP_008771726.1 hypothetical protein Marshall_108 [Salmonella phage Marshall]YP_009880184.1 hypothetical protein HYP60_gp045 [Escherichia phage EP75]YP_009881200.1 hypothetical protein HYP68_gp183 [Salmonella phage SenASZ3]YP_009887996.1 hypothetical protein HYQ32_gp082 [Salmonella phage bering]EKE9231621.1 hypothetical protein [Salmonella enterica]MDR5209305.1 hypothetical protein [Salmonella enterica subsp. enterica serovar Typhim